MESRWSIGHQRNSYKWQLSPSLISCSLIVQLEECLVKELPTSLFTEGKGEIMPSFKMLSSQGGQLGRRKLVSIRLFQVGERNS